MQKYQAFEPRLPFDNCRKRDYTIMKNKSSVLHKNFIFCKKKREGFEISLLINFLLIDFPIISVYRNLLCGL